MKKKLLVSDKSFQKQRREKHDVNCFILIGVCKLEKPIKKMIFFEGSVLSVLSVLSATTTATVATVGSVV